MCIAPVHLVDGTATACHKCWQCRENTVNDWVGRNIAESKTASKTFAVTLTYGRNSDHETDHERSAILTFSDVQKFLKLLRRHGYTVRYHVTGEFGSRKGRAHWHPILYFYGKVPPVVLGKNWNWEAIDADGKRVLDQKTGEQAYFWPHGFAFITRPTHHAIRYNTKYILKGMGDDDRQGHMSMSKKPPLGSAYFEDLAERYVKQGLAPQTLEYKFPEAKRRKEDGSEEVIAFRLKDRSAELYLDHYFKAWARAYPDRAVPNSPILQEYLDDTLKERRRINDWFSELPPNLTPAHRLDIDRKMARLRELDKVGQPLVADPRGPVTEEQKNKHLARYQTEQALMREWDAIAVRLPDLLRDAAFQYGFNAQRRAIDVETR